MERKRSAQDLNYYEHHLGDYLRDTAHLSLLEEGAYRRLLDQYYIREKPLPANIDVVCRLARTRGMEEEDAVRAVLEEFFVLTDSGYTHKRCDAEIDIAHAKRAKAQNSANARWSGKRAQCDGNANAMRTQCDGNALQSPIPNPQEEELMSPSGDVVRVFAHWQTVHGKGRAKLDDKRKRLIRAALKIHPVDDLCRCIDGYKRSPFHQGKNERGVVYDDIHLMLRDAKQIEQGIKFAEGASEVIRWR